MVYASHVILLVQHVWDRQDIVQHARKLNFCIMELVIIIALNMILLVNVWLLAHLDFINHQIFYAHNVHKIVQNATAQLNVLHVQVDITYISEIVLVHVQ